MLWHASAAHGYASPYWLTFNQAIKLGARVRKGERGEFVVYYGSAQRTEIAADGAEIEAAFRFLKAYVTFNADQIEALPERFYPRPSEEAPMPIEAHERWFARLDIARILTRDTACYAAFEGYAGSSRSGFRAEIAPERALGQIDDVMTYFDAHQDGLSLSGPASKRVKHSLDTAVAELSPLPGRVADRAKLRTLLKDIARTLHVGPLADCFFDPAHALCLKRATDLERDTPAMALCEPTRCPNACFTARHRPVWAKARDDAALMLKEKRRSSAQRTILKADIARYEHVIAAADAPAAAPTAPR